MITIFQFHVDFGGGERNMQGNIDITYNIITFIIYGKREREGKKNEREREQKNQPVTSFIIRSLYAN